MSAPTNAQRGEWEFRTIRLTYRLLCAEARTHSICRFTSLTPHRLAKWRKRWGFSDTERSRGPAPNSFGPFFRHPTLRAEGAYVAVLCEAFRVVLPGRPIADWLFSLETGERLCDLFEFHRASSPAASITFDQLLLLARGLQAGEDIQLAKCLSCGGAVLIDPLQLRREGCDACKSDRSKSSALPALIERLEPATGTPARRPMPARTS